MKYDGLQSTANEVSENVSRLKMTLNESKNNEREAVFRLKDSEDKLDIVKKELNTVRQREVEKEDHWERTLVLMKNEVENLTNNWEIQRTTLVPEKDLHMKQAIINEMKEEIHSYKERIQEMSMKFDEICGLKDQKIIELQNQITINSKKDNKIKELKTMNEN